MAFAVVESTAVSDDNVGAATVTFPAGIIDGDLLVGVTSISSGSSITYPAGWTLADDLNTGGNARSAVWFRQADGTESGTFTVTISPAEKSVHFIFRISGAEPIATQVPQADHATGSSAFPNPPNLNPVGGAKDFLWITGMFIRNLGGSVPPTGYGNTLIRAVTTGHGATARRLLNADQENPGTWDATPSGTSWVAMTAAIHPSSAIAVDLSGTIIGDTELDVRNGGSTIILDTVNDTWVAAGATFNAERQGIIDGLDSGGAEPDGWDAAVRTAIAVTDVVRTSDTRVTITIPTAGVPGYNITANETITATIPAAALVLSADPIIATPTFDITFLTETVALSGTIVYDDDAAIRAGGSTLVLTLTNAQWEANVGANNAQTQALIDGLDSDLAETFGWDAVVKVGLTFANVVRTTDFIVTITLPAFGTYNIVVNETITATIPASALNFPNAIVASPTLLITDLADTAPVVAAAVTSIDTNSPHTVTLPSGIVSGNLLVILFATREFIDNPTLANWTRIVEANIESDPNGRITFAVFTRRADGTEGASVDVTTTFSVDSAHIAYRITGMENPNTRSPQINVGSFVVTNTPNPPALTPAGGAKHYLWLAMAVTQKGLTTNISEYGNLITANAVGIDIHAVRINRNIATEDPATPVPPLTDFFTLNDPGDPDITLAPTLVIHPLIVDVSGTIITAAADELDIRNGGSTIILTLTTDDWVAAGPTFDAQRQGIINGLDSAQAEANGWDAVARPAIQVGDVVRTSAKIVTITMPVVPGYSITANETITATVPASALQNLTSPEEADPPFVITSLSESAAVTGTITAVTESDIRAGGSSIILTLTNVQWEANVGADNPQTQALIDGLDSAGAEPAGWDAIVRVGLTFANVVRTTDFIVTITLPAFPGYNISADETITPTIPASALDFPDALVGAPSWTVNDLPPPGGAVGVIQREIFLL